MNAYDGLISGYREFRANYLADDNKEWLKVAGEKQDPKVMMVACSDSRVHPAILTRTALGELFIVRNVANVVPPFEKISGDSSYHGTSAAIEYAINHLFVEHIIVMGHSGCGGIGALMNQEITGDTQGYSFIKPWMNVVEKASEFSELEEVTMNLDVKTSICEKRAVLISLNNLVSFPWVKDAVKAGKLQLHGWYFDIKSGTLSEYKHGSEKFEEIV
ncbi:MAG: carbonic anhydrase [Emcibacteraceae bacterium]|nr:carbonic anhydrase [Emcibacteraceae bacterium]MDG1995187.1 carbonic anhydrase [Emcibacteraceae bacterium]